MSRRPGRIVLTRKIDIPRPRDRKAINHDPRFKEIRREAIGHPTATRKAVADAAQQQVRPLPPLVPAALAPRAPRRRVRPLVLPGTPGAAAAWAPTGAPARGAGRRDHGQQPRREGFVLRPGR